MSGFNADSVQTSKQTLETPQEQNVRAIDPIEAYPDPIPENLKQLFFQGVDPPNLLADYNAIGFNVDHCLGVFKQKELMRHTVEQHLDELQFHHEGYPEEIKNFDYENHLESFFLDCAVWDIQRGTILQLVEGKIVTNAFMGFKKLTQDEICEIYGSPPIFQALKWPETTCFMDNEQEAHWVLMGFADSCKIPIICHIVDLIQKGTIKDKSFLKFAFELKEIVFRQVEYATENGNWPVEEYGRYFPPMSNEPSRFIQKQPKLRGILAYLRSRGKQVFIQSNSHFTYVDLILRETLGDDWEYFFDLVLCSCQKPLFYTANNPFYEFKPYFWEEEVLKRKQFGHHSKVLIHGEKLESVDKMISAVKQCKILLNGNARLLTQYLQDQTAKSAVKIAFFSASYFTDGLGAYKFDKVLQKEGSKARWEAISVVQQMNESSENIDINLKQSLISHNSVNWGPSYFFNAQTNGKSKKLCNFFMKQISQTSRYAVSFIEDIQHMLYESEETELTKAITPDKFIASMGLKKIRSKASSATFRNIGNYRVEERDFGNFVVLTPRNEEHQYSLIWLHGFGTDAQSFKNLFLDQKQFNLPAGCKVIIPTAPIRQVKATGTNMYAWYDLRTFDAPTDGKITTELLDKNFSQYDIQQSVDYALELINTEIDVLGKAQKVFLGGFSQGCSIAIAAYLKFKPSRNQYLGGVVGFSGIHCTILEWQKIDIDEKKKTPFQLYHSAKDPVISAAYAQLSYDSLITRGLYQVKVILEANQEQVEHKFSTESICKLNSFLHESMPKIQTSTQAKKQNDYTPPPYNPNQPPPPNMTQVNSGMNPPKYFASQPPPPSDFQNMPPPFSAHQPPPPSMQPLPYNPQQPPPPSMPMPPPQGGLRQERDEFIPNEERNEFIRNRERDEFMPARGRGRGRGRSQSMGKNPWLKQARPAMPPEMPPARKPKRYDYYNNAPQFTEEQREKLHKLSSLKTLIYRAKNRVKPPTNQNYIRLYGHNLCLFTARSRYALACKKFPFQIIEMNYQGPAQWMKQFEGQLGPRPILETPMEEFITGSMNIVNFALHQADNGGLPILPQEQKIAQNMYSKIEDFNKLANHFFFLYHSRSFDNIKSFFSNKFPLQSHENFATQCNGKFLLGTDHPTVLDVHVAPFWEFLYMLKEGPMAHIYEALNLPQNAPNLLAYIERFREHELIKPYRMNQKVAQNYWLRAKDSAERNLTRIQFGVNDFRGVLTDYTDRPYDPKQLTKTQRINMTKMYKESDALIYKLKPSDEQINEVQSILDKQELKAKVIDLEQISYAPAIGEELKRLFKGEESDIYIFVKGYKVFGGLPKLKELESGGKLKEIATRQAFQQRFIRPRSYTPRKRQGPRVTLNKNKVETQSEANEEKSAFDLEGSLENAMSEPQVTTTIGDRMVGIATQMFNEQGKFNSSTPLGEHVAGLVQQHFDENGRSKQPQEYVNWTQEYHEREVPQIEGYTGIEPVENSTQPDPKLFEEQHCNWTEEWHDNRNKLPIMQVPIEQEFKPMPVLDSMDVQRAANFIKVKIIELDEEGKIEHLKAQNRTGQNIEPMVFVGGADNKCKISNDDLQKAINDGSIGDLLGGAGFTHNVRNDASTKFPVQMQESEEDSVKSIEEDEKPEQEVPKEEIQDQKPEQEVPKEEIQDESADSADETKPKINFKHFSNSSEIPQPNDENQDKHDNKEKQDFTSMYD